MKIPRDVSGQELVRRLSVLGYQVTRQTGSNVRLTTDRLGEHHLTIPQHNPLKIGTLNSILRDLAEHHQIDRDRLAEMLFG